MASKMNNPEGKQKILDAARQVISEKGIAGASMRNIAQEAGLSTGAIYHYYAGKDEVLYDVMAESLSASTRIARRSVHGELNRKETIESILEHIALRFEKGMDSRIQYHLALEAIQGNEVLKAKFKDKYAEWIGNDLVLMDAIGSKLDKDPTNKAMATFLLAAIDGMVLQYELGALDISIDEALVIFRKIFESGFKNI